MSTAASTLAAISRPLRLGVAMTASSLSGAGSVVSLALALVSLVSLVWRAAGGRCNAEAGGWCGVGAGGAGIDGRGAVGSTGTVACAAAFTLGRMMVCSDRSLPHFAQKLALMRLVWPQAEQSSPGLGSGAGAAKGVPQARQNTAASSFWVPHFEQPLGIGLFSGVMRWRWCGRSRPR